MTPLDTAREHLADAMWALIIRSRPDALAHYRVAAIVYDLTRREG